ncbi:TPA: hypothetical protein HA235_03050 [Candidatus Woesearchaeota archaeon]|nr:hypothetical protein [Candidatus Woesearchaeota archaeon]HIH31661.1 hypothetical protein [Candidatus Woesearchaeota archaeon]HIH54823.1 hypothetical protein [Candidatus Woesearchaeota archaeon]HIJ02133.1 hypothetical protein [Candidatus Woesearchaeota archaeon]HIJ13660.1 hypothetical protein [Candidatus Woesearchaeota archaeon]
MNKLKKIVLYSIFAGAFAVGGFLVGRNSTSEEAKPTLVNILTKKNIENGTYSIDQVEIFGPGGASEKVAFYSNKCANKFIEGYDAMKNQFKSMYFYINDVNYVPENDVLIEAGLDTLIKLPNGYIKGPKN